MANFALIVYLFIYLWYSVILLFWKIFVHPNDNNRTAYYDACWVFAYWPGPSNVKGFIIFRSPFCKLNIIISQKMAKRSNTLALCLLLVKAVNKWVSFDCPGLMDAPGWANCIFLCVVQARQFPSIPRNSSAVKLNNWLFDGRNVEQKANNFHCFHSTQRKHDIKA